MLREGAQKRRQETKHIVNRAARICRAINGLVRRASSVVENEPHVHIRPNTRALRSKLKKKRSNESMNAEWSKTKGTSLRQDHVVEKTSCFKPFEHIKRLI